LIRLLNYSLKMHIPPEFDTPVRTFASGYNWREKLAFIKNRVRPSHNFQHLTKPLPPKTIINPNVSPAVKLVFLGDVMPIKDHKLRIDKSVLEFVSDADYFVINLEGVVTDQERMLALTHNEKIVDYLHQYFPAEKTILYTANNHAGDFGYSIFKQQYNWLKTQFFAVIGAHDDAAVQIADGQVNIASVTDLSNQTCNYVAWLRDAEQWFSEEAKFNLLLPHWGYEMQLYPHPEQIKSAKKLLQQWNMLAGNHSHCVQPVAKYKTDINENRAVIYSMGNFCYHHRWPHHRFGKIVKAEIGPNPQGNWQTGALQWAYTRHDVRSNNDMVVRIATQTRYQGRVILAQLAQRIAQPFVSIIPAL
jgi:hypothetical protein